MDRLTQRLAAIVGERACLTRPEELFGYECDGLTLEGTLPAAVVLPSETRQVADIVRACLEAGRPFVPRGAGTGLSGGAHPVEGAVVIECSRMNRILEVNPGDRIAVVQPGVVNADLSRDVAQHGLFYAPDPSSQRACTIGGNVAENSGGPHCLAYGVTTNHVLGMEVVLADGTVQWIGGRTRESVGFDLRGILVGSEGTLAIVTKVVVRLLTKPESVKTLLAIFKDLDDASAAVSGIIGAGIVPAALEMMDDLCIQAAEASVHAGYPEGAGAVLLVEVDGITESVEEEVEAVEEVCNRFRPIEIRTATDAEERERLWAGRKGVLGALGRLAPNYLLVDGTVPRTKLVEVLSKIRQMSVDTGYPIANLLHAGDGNLHPSVLFDERIPGDTKRALEIGGEILELCVEVGGVLSGEHGIGLEKQDHMPLMFNESDLAVMAKLKPSFATEDSLNPGKVFPTGATCGDVRQAAAIARVGPGAYV